MQEECSTLFGRISVNVGAETLCDWFAKAGLVAQVRGSAHYEGGRYVRVELGDAHAAFELTAAEVIVRGDAGSRAALSALMAALDSALAGTHAHYQLELYAGNWLIESRSG